MPLENFSDEIITHYISRAKILKKFNQRALLEAEKLARRWKVYQTLWHFLVPKIHLNFEIYDLSAYCHPSSERNSQQQKEATKPCKNFIIKNMEELKILSLQMNN